MLEKKDHVKRIQEITFEAYKSSGRIAALLDQNTGPSEQLSEELGAGGSSNRGMGR